MDAALRWFLVGTRHLGLTPRQAEAVWWRAGEGCPPREVAARMFIEPDTVGAHLYAAGVRLRCPYATGVQFATALWEYFETARSLARFGPPGKDHRRG